MWKITGSLGQNGAKEKHHGWKGRKIYFPFCVTRRILLYLQLEEHQILNDLLITVSLKQGSSCSKADIPRPAMWVLSLPCKKYTRTTCSLCHSPLNISPVLCKFTISISGITDSITQTITCHIFGTCISHCSAITGWYNTTVKRLRFFQVSSEPGATLWCW